MTILQVVQSAASQIGLEIPSQVYASTEREMVEMRNVISDTAKRIAFQTHDWTVLRKIHTETGDGVARSFDFPSDYKRMLKKGQVWQEDDPWNPLVQVMDTDEWLGMQVTGFQLVERAWTIYGKQLHVTEVVPNNIDLSYVYLTKNIVEPASGSNKPEFTADDDTFVLNENLLRLGIVYQWKVNKGMEYAEDLANYETALAYEVGADKGPGVLVARGRRWKGLDTRWAYPRTLGS